MFYLSLATEFYLYETIFPVAQMNDSITFKTVLIAIVIYITVNSLGIHSEVTYAECFKNKTECLQIID